MALPANEGTTRNHALRGCGGQASGRGNSAVPAATFVPAPSQALGRAFAPLPPCSTRSGSSGGSAAACERLLGTAARPLSRPSSGPPAAAGRAVSGFARAEAAVPCNALPPEASADMGVVDPIKATRRLAVPFLCNIPLEAHSREMVADALKRRFPPQFDRADANSGERVTGIPVAVARAAYHRVCFSHRRSPPTSPTGRASRSQKHFLNWNTRVTAPVAAVRRGK